MNDRRQTGRGSSRCEITQKIWTHARLCPAGFIFSLCECEFESFSLSRLCLAGLQSQHQHRTWLPLPLHRSNCYAGKLLSSQLLCLCTYPTLILLKKMKKYTKKHLIDTVFSAVFPYSTKQYDSKMLFKVVLMPKIHYFQQKHIRLHL